MTTPTPTFAVAIDEARHNIAVRVTTHPDTVAALLAGIDAQRAAHRTRAGRAPTRGAQRTPRAVRVRELRHREQRSRLRAVAVPHHPCPRRRVLISVRQYPVRGSRRIKLPSFQEDPMAEHELAETSVPAVTVGLSPKTLWAGVAAFLLPLLVTGGDALLGYLLDNPSVFAVLPPVVQVPLLAILASLAATVAAYRASPGSVVVSGS